MVMKMLQGILTKNKQKFLEENAAEIFIRYVAVLSHHLRDGKISSHAN
jgi:hypothetical protein